MEDQAEKLREIMRQKDDARPAAESRAAGGMAPPAAESRAAGGAVPPAAGEARPSGGASPGSSGAAENRSAKGAAKPPAAGEGKNLRADGSAARAGQAAAPGKVLPGDTSPGDISPPKKDGKTRIITITSGKGGVGKTNVSVNLALAYARLGKKVVVMDADLGLANVNIMLNMVPKYNLYDMIRKGKTMKEIMVETDYGISIVAGALGISQVANLSDEERRNFINELNTLSFADIIIIDTSAGVSSNVLDFIAAADDAVIVTTPEPTAITDAYGIIKIIATEYDNLDMELKLVVNRVKSAAEAKKVADRMTNIAGQFLNLKVDYLGFIYDDPVVSQAVLKQKPFVVIDPRSKASICVQHIVGKMEKTELRETGGFASMFKRLFTRRG